MSKQTKRQYRIVAKFYRQDSTGEVKSYAIIQYLRTWLFKERWVNLTEECCYGTDCYTRTRHFKNKKEARSYLQNLKKKIPNDKITYE